MTLQVVNDSGSYRVSLHRDRWRTEALAIAPLLDPWTQRAPAGVAVRALTPRTRAHVAGTRLVVTGLAEHALPTLDTAPAELAVELRRHGHPPQLVTIALPTGAVLPFEAPAVSVSAATIRLAGRVTSAAFPHGPIAGAAIAIAGVVGALLTVETPLARPHAEGTAVRVRPLTPGAATKLVAPVVGGATVLTVASTAGITPGTVLAVGRDLVVAESTTGPIVRLRVPMATSAAAEATVTIHAPGAPGSSVSLAGSTLAGDGLLPVSSALDGPFVEIVDGGGTEYRRTSLVTDADGRWTLAGVRGIPEIALTTSAPGFQDDGPRRCPLAPIDPFVVDTSLRT